MSFVGYYRIHITKLLLGLESCVNQAQGPDPALLVRLTEVRATLEQHWGPLS